MRALTRALTRTLTDEFGPLDRARTRLTCGTDAVLRRQIALAGIPAPTGHEWARGECVSTTLRTMHRSLQHTVQRDGAGNIVARIDAEPVDSSGVPSHQPTAAPVVVMSHLDTALHTAHETAHTHTGDHVIGPGISDNARGLAAMIALAGELSHPDVRTLLRRPIELVATVGEEGEGNLRGARHYLDQAASLGAIPHAVVALDGPGDSAIVHQGIGSRRLRITLAGPGGHSWVDRQTRNPITECARWIAAIGNWRGRLPGDRAVTVTRMGGGESLTSLPQQAWFDVDIRGKNDRAIVECERMVQHIGAETIGQDGYTVTLLGERPSGLLSPDHPVVVLAARATEWSGATPVHASASTDANIALSRSIPAIAIGAGGTGGALHTVEEWFRNTHAARGVARALAIIVGLSRS